MDNQTSVSPNIVSPTDTELEVKKKSSGVGSAIGGIFKAFFLLLFRVFKTFLNFFWVLSIGAKLIFIVIIILVVMLSFFIGYISGGKAKENEIANEVGVSYEDLRMILKELKGITNRLPSN